MTRSIYGSRSSCRRRSLSRRDLGSAIEKVGRQYSGLRFDDEELTNASWTAPQKHVADASSSLLQPSVTRPDTGKSPFFSDMLTKSEGNSKSMRMDGRFLYL